MQTLFHFITLRKYAALEFTSKNRRLKVFRVHKKRARFPRCTPIHGWASDGFCGSM